MTGGSSRGGEACRGGSLETVARTRRAGALSAISGVETMVSAEATGNSGLASQPRGPLG